MRIISKEKKRIMIKDMPNLSLRQQYVVMYIYNHNKDKKNIVVIGQLTSHFFFN